MRRFLLSAPVLLAAGLSIQPAAAQRSGVYAVEGRGADGTAYQGSATLTATGPQTWRMTWRVAGETTNGIALTVGKLLVIGYVAGRETGVVAYEVMEDGRLVGRWTQGREGGVGTEVLTPR
ncbi:hypothetical protein [Sediminicoccus rosea]|uniref:Uncharacterized protein n=1 Tax=Sediminicoccus rosea TaxID=1225128 RepID=A0ABZ0PP55_9PROT|nr:hypothetical protein [Sediminicoccus rosea]WPB87320.1 hypothetical protein R9Z33_10650 [Sediminicoccus rosea]